MTEGAQESRRRRRNHAGGAGITQGAQESREGRNDGGGAGMTQKGGLTQLCAGTFAQGA